MSERENIPLELVKLIFVEGRKIIPFYLAMDSPLQRGQRSSLLGNFIFSHAYYALFCDLFNKCVIAGKVGIIVGVESISRPFSETVLGIKYNQLKPGNREEAADRLARDFSLKLEIERAFLRPSRYVFSYENEETREKMLNYSQEIVSAILNRRKVYNNESAFSSMDIRREEHRSESLKSSFDELKKAREIGIPESIRELSVCLWNGDYGPQIHSMQCILSLARPVFLRKEPVQCKDVVFFFEEKRTIGERREPLVNVQLMSQPSIQIDDEIVGDILNEIGGTGAWYHGLILRANNLGSYFAIHFAVDGIPIKGIHFAVDGIPIKGKDLERFFDYSKRHYSKDITMLFGAHKMVRRRVLR